MKNNNLSSSVAYQPQNLTQTSYQPMQYPYLNPNRVSYHYMPDYFAYLPAKVESVLKEKEPPIVYVEFYDKGKVLVSTNESVKEGDMVIVGRKALSINPLVTKDEIVKVLTEDNEKIFKDYRTNFEDAQQRQKEITNRQPAGIG